MNESKIPYNQMTLREKVLHVEKVAEFTKLVNIAVDYWSKNTISNNQHFQEQVERMMRHAFELRMVDFLLLMGATFKLKLSELQEKQNMEFVKLIK